MGCGEALQEMRLALERDKGKQEKTEQEIKERGNAISQLEKQLAVCDKALVIAQTVARLTQEQLEIHISDIVSSAMSAVFDDPYEIKVEFVVRRGKTEADIYFVRDGKKVDPLSCSGGGAVDVAALALQIAMWSLTAPRTRNVLILDEPLKWLKGGDLPERGAAMIKEISKKLGIQIIMVSHSPQLIDSADAVFDVRMTKKGSRIVK